MIEAAPITLVGKRGGGGGGGKEEEEVVKYGGNFKKHYMDTK